MIHLVSFTSAPGGIEVSLLKIIRSFPENFFKIFIIRPSAPDKVNVYTNTRIPVSYGDRNNFPAMIALLKYSLQNKNDTYHVFNIGPFFLLILKLAGVKKIVYSIRGSIYWRTLPEKLIRKPLWQILINRRITFVANSNYSREIFKRTFNIRDIDIEVLYNPIAPFSLSCDVNIIKDKQQFEIIYVGRLVKGKNLFLWIDVAKRVSEEFPFATFSLYGDGPLLSDLERYATDLGLKDSLCFKGYREDISTVYRRADLLLFLSEYESFGNVAVESILCNTPVIVSAIPSMLEIFKNYPQFIVSLDESVSKSVIEKIRAIEQLRDLLPGVQNEFNQRFSVTQHIEKLKNIYGVQE
ncbi:MAG: glycosyltransferase family 4 protein [Candidatus Methanofastidiosa archaeon]|nr:glycosyltransferase family 4 protein [Candidatus Methanofastidiosa archaeon]